MKWCEFFVIVYHPMQERYIVHWKETMIPVAGAEFQFSGAAHGWIADHWQRLILTSFEKEVLGEEDETGRCEATAETES